MPWQYWNSGLIYAGVGVVTLPLMIRYRMTPYDLIFANPGLPYGGMEIGSKHAVLERLRGHSAFLEHLLLRRRNRPEANIRRFEAFRAETGIDFPVIAKPDLGCVGFGVRKVDSLEELQRILALSPVDYLVQEYWGAPAEYSVFFVRMPGSAKGEVPSLTEKEIPIVTGNGRSSMRELIEADPRFTHNRRALMSHARHLDRIPGDGEAAPVLVQASHTYGTFFYDRCDWIDGELEIWVNRLCESIPDFNFIRFDLKAAGRDSLRNGEGVKIVEVNGCMSEPVHMYDARHGLGFGARAFFQFYRMAFQVARSNMTNGNRPPYGRMNRAYLRFFRNKRKIMRAIG